MKKDYRKVALIEELKGSPTLGLAAGTIAFFAGFAAVALFGTTARMLAQVLNLSIYEVGWLVAIPMITGSFLRIPFSALVDKYGGKIILLIQLFIALVGMIGLIFVVNAILSRAIVSPIIGYTLLMIFGATAGTGISTFSPGITYVSYWFPQKKQGFVLGFYAGIGNTAPGIFTVILPFALISLGLVYSYIAWALFLVIMIVVFSLIGYDNYYFQLVKKGVNHDEAIKISKARGIEIFPSGSAVKSLKDSAKEWRIWLLVEMYFVSFGGFLALTAWLPTYWVNYIHTSVVVAGVVTGIAYSLITALIRVFGGWLSDKLGGEQVALFSYTVIILGSLILIFGGINFAINLMGIVVMAIGMGIANAAVYKLVPKYATSAVGGASGLVGGLGAAGGLLIPPIMAYFVDILGASGYSFGFVLFTILAIISLVFSLILIYILNKKII